MRSTFFGLNIGQTGLYAYQAALDTTSHNIANTETQGYTRQAMTQTAGKALQVNSSYGMAGSGVNVTGVEQMREQYYDMKFWKNNKLFGEYSTKSHYMTEVENYFNDISVDGFTESFNSMYKSLQELMKNPASDTVRTQFINYAESLTEYFNSVATNLKSIQEECNFEIRNQIDQVNSTSQQIAALTKQINTLEIGGGTANDLRDQRALLVDELSHIANTAVTEKVVGEGASGVTSYVVKIDGITLIDGGNYNALKVIPRSTKDNQNDIDGLYDIVWENGQEFTSGSASLGGSLQALLEVRDGNNQFNLSGNVNAVAGETNIIMTDTNINNIEDLNIPETGCIKVGNREYEYTGFEVTKDAETGNFIYTFELKDYVTVDAANVKAEIGTSINYKGIPYYMNQMNKFIRTYAKAFNDVHRDGLDLNGKPGADLFSATNKINGRNYTFGPLRGSNDEAYYDYSTFNSQTGGYYEEVPDDQPLYGTYYFMVAGNFSVNKEFFNNPKLLATSSDIVNGTENNDIVSRLLALKDNRLMFEQGSPDEFFNTLVAEVGIDTDTANTFSDSQSNILEAITNQRLSVSGVDIDEEAMNLVRYQNAYNLSAKVITVMDEVYDKLINYMGI
jgi:flagellar hook-associated protein 1 FlgK